MALAPTSSRCLLPFLLLVRPYLLTRPVHYPEPSKFWDNDLYHIANMNASYLCICIHYFCRQKYLTTLPVWVLTQMLHATCYECPLFHVGFILVLCLGNWLVYIIFALPPSQSPPYSLYYVYFVTYSCTSNLIISSILSIFSIMSINVKFYLIGPWPSRSDYMIYMLSIISCYINRVPTFWSTRVHLNRFMSYQWCLSIGRIMLNLHRN